VKEPPDSVRAGAASIGEPDPTDKEGAVATRLPRARAIGEWVWENASQGLIFGVLLTLIVFFSILLPNQFPTAFNVRSMGISASVIALLAIGQTFVIIGGGIDLSVGAVLVFSGVISAKLMAAMGPAAPLPALIVVGAGGALLSGAAWGLLNGLLVVRTRIPDLIVTLGTMGIALGLAQVLTNGVDVSVPLPLTTELGNGNAIGGIPWLVVIALVVAAIMQVTLSATRFGRHTFAVGSNREAGRRVGVKVDAHRIKLYTISGLLAGFGGFLSLALYTNTTIAAHSTDNLVSIAAVIIGGTSLFGGMGSVLRSVAGVLVPVVLQNGFVIMGLRPFWQPVAIGIVLLAAVYIDGRRRAAG
jgi:ribose transport system permease protein